MKIERRKRFSREEFAELLSDFARTITEEKRIVFEDMEVALPDSFEAEIEYKEKHGYAKFEIEVFWDIEKNLSTSPYYPTTRGEGTIQNEPIPRRFKEIKRIMEQNLADISRVISAGNNPPENDLNYFRELNRAFSQQSEPDWLNGMNELQTAVEGMIDAAKQGNFPLAIERIREINNIKKECHRVFK
ncbi:MAG: hypothetical protein PH343_03150 [Nitrospira sp.]|nr:hypothetical protein [Nitrospira sp.]